MKLNVYAFGSALVDIQVQVDDAVFHELGVEKGNMYLTETKPPGAGTQNAAWI